MPADKRRRPKIDRPAAPTSWDPLATWYNGWVGEGGSEHHREVAVPAVMRLLLPEPGENILDIGCGQGVLAPFIARTGAQYTGVDASPRLIQMARQHHAKQGRFLVGDARGLSTIPDLSAGSFDAVIFLLSLQDMDPLEPVLASAAWALKADGRVILFLTHPAFRVPRQSGWGWDEGRKLMFRRVDRYLTPLPVPMKPFPGREAHGKTRSFHRPIHAYVNGLTQHGLLIDRFEEIPAHKDTAEAPSVKAERMARREIPLFLGLRAQRVPSLPSRSGRQNRPPIANSGRK